MRNARYNLSREKHYDKQKKKHQVFQLFLKLKILEVEI